MPVATPAAPLPCQGHFLPPVHGTLLAPAAMGPEPQPKMKKHPNAACQGFGGRSEMPPATLRGCPVFGSSQKPLSMIATRARRGGGLAVTSCQAFSTFDLLPVGPNCGVANASSYPPPPAGASCVLER